MKKIYYFVFLAMVVFVLAACGDSDEASGSGGVTLKMSTLSADGALIHEGYEKFKEVIEEENEDVKVELYANGQLASSDDQQLELVMNGTAHVLSVPTSTVSTATGINALNLFDVPFLFPSLEEMYAVLDSEIGDNLAKQIEEKTNVKVLGFIDLGTFSIGNTSKPIKKPEDLEGLKIRSMNAKLHINTVEALGATPSPLAYGEVYTGLEQGTIDGLQTTTSLIYGDRLYEPLNYLTVTRHVALPHVLMVNKGFYEGLTDEQKAAVDKAAEEHIKFARQLSIDDEKVAIDTMKEAGVEVHELSDEEIAMFSEQTKAVAENNMDILDEEVYQQVLEFLNK
ncbi:TRAP transporter substrate-binding protein [Oceanobacillus sp. FSL K6-2867]|uniref:TRAP transporter substrate-binding protein n=1 Tax=Oceanobacillus sp. FSL K6-2867 TaxID=2954748 RepID=UPI0030DB5CF6